MTSGFDRRHVPKRFIQMFHSYFNTLVYVDTAPTNKANTKKQKPSRVTVFNTSRERYYHFVCASATTQYEYLEIRYNDKRDFYNSHKVNIILHLKSNFWNQTGHFCDNIMTIYFRINTLATGN